MLENVPKHYLIYLYRQSS